MNCYRVISNVRGSWEATASSWGPDRKENSFQTGAAVPTLGDPKGADPWSWPEALHLLGSLWRYRDKDQQRQTTTPHPGGHQKLSAHRDRQDSSWESREETSDNTPPSDRTASEIPPISRVPALSENAIANSWVVRGPPKERLAVNQAEEQGPKDHWLVVVCLIPLSIVGLEIISQECSGYCRCTLAKSSLPVNAFFMSTLAGPWRIILPFIPFSH